MNTSVTEYNEAAASIPSDALLGSLVWYTLSEVDLNVQQARKSLENHGLDVSMLKSIRPVDAFRLATKDLAKNFPTRDGVKLNILVRSTGQDASAAYRQIVVERVTTKQGQRRKLIYDPSAELTYHRGKRNKDGEVEGDRIEIVRRTPPGLDNEMTEEQRRWLEDGLDQLPEKFKHLRTHYSSHKIRNFVREYITNRLSGVAVRESGGVYFVRQSHSDELERLGTWIHSFGSAFHSTPLLDLVNQRQMLAQAFEEEAVREVERLSGEIDKILSDEKRTVREKTFDDYALRAAELTAKAQEYAEMLDIRSEIAHKRIAGFKQRTLELVDRIDYKSED